MFPEVPDEHPAELDNRKRAERASGMRESLLEIGMENTSWCDRPGKFTEESGGCPEGDQAH